MAWSTDAADAAEKLVNDALCSRKAELGLSFYDFPDLGWAIRSHLIGLVSEFPTFLPSAGALTKQAGNVNVLVNATGRLHVPSPIRIPPLYLTLWLPRRYPLAPPMAFVSCPGPDATLAHPYLDPTTGEATAAPYLTSWEFPLSNLAELARSLASAFESYPPFPVMCSPSGRIVYNLEEYEPQEYEPPEEYEPQEYEPKEYEPPEEYEPQEYEPQEYEPPEEYEPQEYEPPEEYEPSWEALQLVGACRAIDDLLVALDKSLEERVVSMQEYLKQVRSHAREQFFLTAKARKVAMCRAGKPENRGYTVESFSGTQQRKPKLGT